MVTANQAYSQYPIPQSLRVHQLRVAAVAQQIIDAQDTPSPEASVIMSACLLHDMGNLIKFKLDQLPALLEPEGVAYWADQQASMRAGFGSEEHEATYAIARELGVSLRTQELLHAVGFSQSIANVGRGFAEQLVCYADQRVSPQGITSLEIRLAEGSARYAGRTDRTLVSDAEYTARVAALQEIERQLFEHCSISPDAITDASSADLIKELGSFMLY